MHAGAALRNEQQSGRGQDLGGQPNRNEALCQDPS
jgi:hypothetical protein